MDYNHRITRIRKVNNKNVVLSFYINEKIFKYPSFYTTDNWLDYNNWCDINATIENIDQNDFTKILKEPDKPIFRNISESHIVLKIISKKVTAKLIEAIQLILNNNSIEFNCYLEVDITYDPDYNILPKCDSGLSFEQVPVEPERISSYSPSQQNHDAYTPKSIETHSSLTMEISPVYKSNQIQKTIEEYVPEGTNTNCIVYTPSKVSNKEKEHDGYNPVNPVTNGKENNNEVIKYVPAKTNNVTKRRRSVKSPAKDMITTEKRRTRSSSQSPLRKEIVKSTKTSNDKPSTSKRSSTKDSDFIEPLEKKAKQKSNEKKDKFDKLFGNDIDSSQESDVIETKSIDFFENEELLSQTSQTSVFSNKSVDLFDDSDIMLSSGLSQEKEDSIELRMKDMLERYPETLDTNTEKTPISKSKKNKSSSKDEYASEKKGISSFLSKKTDDSKDKILNSWLSTKLIEPEVSSKKNKEEPSKKARTKGPTKAEREEIARERSKKLEKSAKELEKLKELSNEFVSLTEVEEEKVEILNFNTIDCETFCSYIHKKRKVFNKIFAEYCQQKTHKVNPHKVNFLIIPKLIEDQKHMAVIQEFSNIFKKSNDDNVPVLDKYEDLYFEQMMPELVLLLSMKLHDMTRDEAINRINKQSQHHFCESQMEDTFIYKKK